MMRKMMKTTMTMPMTAPVPSPAFWRDAFGSSSPVEGRHVTDTPSHYCHKQECTKSFSLVNQYGASRVLYN